MELTVNDLKSQKYGTACGTEAQMRKECLSEPIVIDYIDEYFDGKFYDVELDNNELLSGEAKFSKEVLDQNFVDKYCKYVANIQNISVDEYIESICDNLDGVCLRGYNIKLKNFKKFRLNIEESRDVICWVFAELIAELHGSLRFECYGEETIDIESE